MKYNSLNPDYLFENFLRSECNQEICALGMNMVHHSLPFKSELLYVYGGSDIGKTHWVSAIGNEMKRTNLGAQILYLHAKEFIIQYMNEVHINNMYLDFVDSFKRYDLLIVDNFEEITPCPMLCVQSTLLQILKDAQQRNASVIVVDNSEKSLHHVGMNRELLELFQSGIQLKFPIPDKDLLRIILTSKSEQCKLGLTHEVIDAIIKYCNHSLTQLDEHFTALMAKSVIEGRKIDANFVENYLLSS